MSEMMRPLPSSVCGWKTRNVFRRWPGVRSTRESSPRTELVVGPNLKRVRGTARPRSVDDCLTTYSPDVMDLCL